MTMPYAVAAYFMAMNREYRAAQLNSAPARGNDE